MPQNENDNHFCGRYSQLRHCFLSPLFSPGNKGPEYFIFLCHNWIRSSQLHKIQSMIFVRRIKKRIFVLDASTAKCGPNENCLKDASKVHLLKFNTCFHLKFHIFWLFCFTFFILLFMIYLHRYLKLFLSIKTIWLHFFFFSLTLCQHFDLILFELICWIIIINKEYLLILFLLFTVQLTEYFLWGDTMNVGRWISIVFFLYVFSFILWRLCCFEA